MAEQDGWGEVASFVGQGLRAMGLGLKLLPSAVYHLTRGHRRFSQCFVQEAVRYGIPKEIAREMAGELRPARLMKAIGLTPAGRIGKEKRP